MLIKQKHIFLKIPEYITYSFLNFSKNKKFKKYIFKGPLGNIFNYFINNINLNLNLKNNFIVFLSENKKTNIFLKLYSSLIQNIFKGVLSGFHIFIKLKGLSYRIWKNKKNNYLLFRLGYCHYIKYSPTINIFLKKLSRRKFFLFSIDNLYFNYILKKLLNYRLTDHYKGQGILYKYQRILLKSSKKGSKNRY